jgi:hypothetical protein
LTLRLLKTVKFLNSTLSILTITSLLITHKVYYLFFLILYIVACPF